MEPYRARLLESIGRPVASIELFPASEGFLAFQDQPGNPGLLLRLDSGIFFEFVPAERFFEDNPPRLTIAEPSRHEWLVEFARPPHDAAAFTAVLDHQLRQRNTYYDDLRQGNILVPLLLTPLPAGAFQRYMKSVGKLGGQNKVPRLGNDRALAEGLLAYAL
uniref:GH3 C-terminal domain-containing protein n=1 Tax=Tanacetum cinerariifolium TaxID=118510 RepID=A0A699QXS5_TANCI|nr:hypothetical protein [Tanacetum cinerariifolium]